MQLLKIIVKLLYCTSRLKWNANSIFNSANW